MAEQRSMLAMHLLVVTYEGSRRESEVPSRRMGCH